MQHIVALIVSGLTTLIENSVNQEYIVKLTIIQSCILHGFINLKSISFSIVRACSIILLHMLA